MAGVVDSEDKQKFLGGAWAPHFNGDYYPAHTIGFEPDGTYRLQESLAKRSTLNSPWLARMWGNERT